MALSVAGIAVGASLLGGNAGATAPAQPPLKIGGVSNMGQAGVKLLSSDPTALQEFHQSGALLGEVRLLGTLGDRTYYRIHNSNGPDCYAVGPSQPIADYQLGQIQCAQDFPSQDRPLLDFTVMHGGPGKPDVVWRSEGIAADGISAVAFRTKDGQVVGRTTVANNLYHASVPSNLQVAEILALDSNGTTVQSMPLGR